MNSIEIEGKTYEEAIKKASEALNVEEKDLDVDVKEVDTKGILGLLGSKKIRITARIKGTASPVAEDKPVSENTIVPEDAPVSEDTPEQYGTKFLTDVATITGLHFNIKVSKISEKLDRLLFMIQCDNGDVFVGKDGEILEALQYLLRLAIAKHYKQSAKILVDINGFREKRKKALTIMAKRLADRVRRTGRRQTTDPLNPYERRIIHTLFKHNKNIATKSEGDGHIKKVIISASSNRPARAGYRHGNR
ncbi:MAG TPA: RNA-binding cell elongation regulator Jag/EloR [Syntrophorhabdus sp.]|jgi:spoIIIJ-associated protein|nr:Jag N-terminal domain-containing protein [Syntrophorhabdus sp.]MDI9558389.1 RNA-binding cell elongation regulator Jag/EloR [Pseudomonadota bacterium]OPX96402.1 MAG: R3H domain protein [Syntrophorhabdus sp. PtaB.Bin027]OQB76517.1 MAG: R3H domain protein [Deltaproteobacteria bacterium ADurb.Bin135]HNS79086.1 RNA-binding cell elongation regulator Jag/EloR [Syntrophorhabdus sp.]